MAISFNVGHLNLDEFRGVGSLMVIHGGAGPADPKDSQMDEAHVAVTQIVKEVGNRYFEFPSYFTTENLKLLGQMSDAEKLALRAAYLLENNTNFNAGLGAALQADGKARVSASYMESNRMKFSAVTNITNLKNPSLLAFYLQNEIFCCLDATGAESLARKLCFPVEDLVVPHRLEKWLEYKQESLKGKSKTGRTGTIGAVAIDPTFHLAAVTSTGGVSNETVGRVGDCPTVAGNYCSQLCAVSCTGWGEQIINDAVAARVAVRVGDGLDLEEAMRKTLEESAEKSHRLAAIAVARSPDKQKISWVTGSTSPKFVWAAKIGKKVISFRDT